MFKDSGPDSCPSYLLQESLSLCSISFPQILLHRYYYTSKIMKVILTGSTGFIGLEVLSQYLRIPSITSIVVLSRRELPKETSSNPKLQTIVMRDFNSYPKPIMRQLAGADACIWCMETTAGNIELEVDYPLAFANAFSKTLPKTNKKVRYIHPSGGKTERDQSVSLWFKSDMSKMKGEAELNMLSFSNQKAIEGLWSTLIVKSGFELRSPRDIIDWLAGDQYTIRVNELAAFMIDAAINGWEEGEDTVSSVKAMILKGREALSTSS
ncbi:hypothetical protein B0J14DRAFT_535209 [Halenospora varia]|nr:hypothetical protein B0J14DRAFT_535209 [Halenospora varia]